MCRWSLLLKTGSSVLLQYLQYCRIHRRRGRQFARLYVTFLSAVTSAPDKVVLDYGLRRNTDHPGSRSMRQQAALGPAAGSGTKAIGVQGLPLVVHFVPQGPISKFHNLPKQCHQLVIKYSSMWASVRKTFTFKPNKKRRGAACITSDQGAVCR